MGKADQGLGPGERRYKAVPRVLVFLRSDSEVLLLKGAPNKRIWANLFNGVGGHVESTEDIFSAARREVMEETSIEVGELDLRAVVNIDVGDPKLGILMFVFTGWTSKRPDGESEEGELHWVSLDRLQEYDLVEDLEWLLPRILSDQVGQAPLYLHYGYNVDDELVIRSSD